MNRPPSRLSIRFCDLFGARSGKIVFLNLTVKSSDEEKNIEMTAIPMSICNNSGVCAYFTMCWIPREVSLSVLWGAAKDRSQLANLFWFLEKC